VRLFRLATVAPTTAVPTAEPPLAVPPELPVRQVDITGDNPTWRCNTFESTHDRRGPRLCPAGARIFLGGGPMRMGTYGILDRMTEMDREMNDMPTGG
jgi:hypothetical protein